MADGPEHIFRASALQRAASPDELDHLVAITKPADWILAVVVTVALIAALIWGIYGRIPSRVSGQGILVGSGRVVDAVSAAEGRLASLSISVGDHVERGQVIAQISQTDIEQKYANAVETYKERQREHDDMAGKVRSELAVKAANLDKLEAAFNKVIEATGQRVQSLDVDVKNLEQLMAKGLTTRKTLEDRRLELTEAQQRRTDSQNEILKLHAQQSDLETQREHELQQAEFAANNARREMQALAGTLGRNSQVISPITGRVLEIKISTGSVLAVGTAVVAIEDEGSKLEAVIYIPAEQGKSVKPGSQVRIAPSTVKREEFGMMIGTVSSVSEFPVTPQGMTAVLHNDQLVKVFSHDGAPYAVTVSLEKDDSTTSGYRWAVGQGPPVHLTSGTMAQAEITTRNRRPLDLVVPLIRKLTGIDG
ncbi:NHLP bacteriocin system secretion protein [Bradyrhizobium guangzhouense]|uniref:NHLP bacteriocin system secretion protein n=1 Tax=Bradyrhizobium guangzhouense TaxID=1325095 RepID=A0AAE5X4Q9_9BRAD|nr:NHLP bacteriocin system secretion protein [Bradyrhizobium guangzhouense]QAU48706.1 NHLP bacteriocin system secretion protein [Bradyrhizobium guangzhouense]RXH09665.1 NHLP bacteriocin system secretion protein [Bradyrhizobium guangzhouense]